MKKTHYSDVQPLADFDWSVYDNGFTGGKTLKVNKTVKVKHGEKIYCHESYAQELYDMFESRGWGSAISTAKDTIKGAIYNVVNVGKVSNHEISIDTDSGMTAVIDLNKEKQYLDAIGCPNITNFVNAIAMSPVFKKQLLESGIVGKVVNGGRVSLWEGHLSKIEEDFMDQIKNPEARPAAYNAHVKEINGGGYIVDILGVQCFMPGSLAAAGILTDFNVLLGKTIPVMIVNYLPNSGFVVSYKKYLNAILPYKIKNELSIGMDVSTRVTGTSKNGIFVQFKDAEGEWIFSGLIHRSVMSPDFEKRFDHREFRIGDEFHAYINNIIENEGQYRIVISDEKPSTPKEDKQLLKQED